MAGRYAVLIYRDEASGMYLVDVPDLPGVITEGRTVEEAAKNAQEAIRSHLRVLREMGEEVPQPSAYDFRQVEVG